MFLKWLKKGHEWMDTNLDTLVVVCRCCVNDDVMAPVLTHPSWIRMLHSHLCLCWWRHLQKLPAGVKVVGIVLATLYWCIHLLCYYYCLTGLAEGGWSMFIRGHIQTACLCWMIPKPWWKLGSSVVSTLLITDVAEQTPNSVLKTRWLCPYLGEIILFDVTMQ